MAAPVIMGPQTRPMDPAEPSNPRYIPYASKHTDKETYRHTDTPTHRHTDKQTDAHMRKGVPTMYGIHAKQRQGKEGSVD